MLVPPMDPFPVSNAWAGQGVITVRKAPDGASILERLSYVYPLKLISPRPTANGKAVTVFLLTYGGGLVSGDNTSLSVTVAPSSRLNLLTQGSTKIFKAVDRGTTTSQELHVNLQGDGALIYLPDPVQPFGESVSRQKQVFRVDSSKSSLCVLDWVCEGRKARGECWDLWSWKSKNEVWSSRTAGGVTPADTLLLRDNMVLEDGIDDTSSETLRRKMNGLGIMGTLIIHGKLFDDLGRFFLHEFTSLPRIGARYMPRSSTQTNGSMTERRRNDRHEKERVDGVLWTAAAVRGCVVVKFGAPEVEGARSWLYGMLIDEGTVVREFSEEALFCLR